MQAFALADATTPVGVLDRLASIMDAFEVSGQLTLRQVSRITGLPRSSAHRMLEQLVAKKWLRRDGSDYTLGIRLMELGSLAIHQDRLHSVALPFLRELHRVTGLVVQFGVLDASDVVYLDKIGGMLAGVVPTRVGERSLAERSALGRVLLAFGGFPVGAEAPMGLRQELSRIRESGVAYGAGLLSPGVNCVAAPVGSQGSIIAAVSVSGPPAMLKLDYRSAVPVRLVASSIWRVVGQSGTQFDVQRSMRELRSLPSAGSQALAFMNVNDRHVGPSQPARISTNGDGGETRLA
ncbi:IclR family transcriptional regulator [Rhodococcus sp. IEGM 1241]|uniref:IclR family transcriptional regulator n=1 Tax=Rhodococcus sp. IEGM 1241 TaxID=3082228 RepID=UPI002955C8ED|nr:IclR family transcriptional regulator [Rhodococcus sp. IEGM 1241]MDV8011874.1 IclR family transcriptional regulator [Rhodococcus sp. IEGM 1241]